MTTGKDTHGATPSQLATIKLQKIPAADGSDVNDVQPIEAGKLWSDRPALLLVVRRTGCIACREIANEIWQQASLIRDTYGLELVAIVKENLAEDLCGFREYFGGDIYLDRQMDFFRYLTGGKLVRNSTLMTLLRPTVWAGIKRAQSRGIKNGSLAGESSINGGIYVVSNNGIHYQHNEQVGVLPPVGEVLEACRSVATTESGRAAVSPLSPDADGKMQVDKPRMYCTDTVCMVKS